MEPDYIYLDNNSTTRTDPKVVEVMLPFLTEYYANASSNHWFGKEIKTKVEEARQKIANLINVEFKDIIFTSGGTESINLGLIGYSIANRNRGNRIITCVTEHNAVLEPCHYLESIGFEVIYIPVKQNGIIDLELFENSFNDETLAACIMLANNETGVLQPIQELAEFTHKHNAVFMCDATQAIGKIPCDARTLGIDLLTFSGHKFYGPKGIGGLYIRGYSRKQIQVEPIQFGGKQENGLRSGTINVPGVIGLGKICEIVKNEMDEVRENILRLRNQLEEGLLNINGSFLNGDPEKRLFNTSNICFPGHDANILIGKLKKIALSNGSACSSAFIEPSHVLKAMGLTDDEANSSIRFSLSKYNTSSEISETISQLYNLLK